MVLFVSLRAGDEAVHEICEAACCKVRLPPDNDEIAEHLVGSESCLEETSGPSLDGMI